MIISFPKVSDKGMLTGGEISIKFKLIDAVEPLHHYNFDREANEDIEIIVPNCCTLYIGRNEFNVSANYDELKKQLKEMNELYE